MMMMPDSNNFTNIGMEASAPPPPYDAHTFPVQSKEDQLRDIVNRHEISSFFAGKLQKLKSFKIVFVFDDSGSMNTTLEESPLNTSTNKVFIINLKGEWRNSNQ